MDMQELRKRLMIVFIEELHECVGDMDRHLRSLQQNPEPQVRLCGSQILPRIAHIRKLVAHLEWWTLLFSLQPMTAK